MPSFAELQHHCLSYMGKEGFPLDQLIASKEIQRFSIDRNRKKKDEWYRYNEWEYEGKLYATCSFGSWSHSERKHRYVSWKDETTTKEERREIEKHLKETDAALKEEKTKRAAEAVEEAKTIWKRAKIAQESDGREQAQNVAHPYLISKGIDPIGCRFGKAPTGEDAIILPLYDIGGTIRSLQFIYQDASGAFQKRYLSGGDKRGCFAVLGDLKGCNRLFAAEGYATAVSIYMATGEPVVIAFDCGSLCDVIASLRKKYPHQKIIICGDDDVETQGNPGRTKATQAAQLYNCTVVFPLFPPEISLPSGKRPTDFNDLHQNLSLEHLKSQLPSKFRLYRESLFDLIAVELPPKKDILSPWLQGEDLAMIYAERGIGKTWFCLYCAYAMATGGKYLGFSAPEKSRVLYVDGEMSAHSYQSRMKQIVLANQADMEKTERILEKEHFQTVLRTRQKRPLPDLGTREGQSAIMEMIQDFDVLFLDNLSSLIQSGIENEAESWTCVLEWLIELRNLGKTVIFVHHAGRNGQARGTSRREDNLDIVIKLRKPADKCSSEGSRFEVIFEKNREKFGPELRPFEASLHTDRDGIQLWECKDLEEENRKKAIQMKRDNHSIRDIAQELSINKSTVGRWLKEDQLKTKW